METLETRLNFSGTVPVGGPVASILSDLFISDAANNSIEIYNGLDGSVIGDGVASGTGGLADPRAFAFGPDGNLYVASGGTNAILRFNGTTGAFIDVFNTLGNTPSAIEFGPDGHLYVATTDGSNAVISRFDAFTPGTFVDIFAGAGSAPFDMEFGPDGNLYFTDEVGSDQVIRRVGPGGAELGAAGLGSVLVTIPNSAAVGIAIDAAGNLYVGDDSNGSIKRFTSEGVFINEFVAGGTGGLSNPEDIDFGADGHLYAISSSNGGEVLEFSEIDGSFIGTLVANGSGGLSGPSFMLFAPGFDQPVQDAEFVDIDIVWRDDVAVNVGTLGLDEDLRLIAPNGAPISAAFQSVDNGTNGTPRVATYRVAAPGGFWGAEDNGFYRVEAVSGNVSDTSANGNDSRVLGRLLVNLEHQTPTFDQQGSQLTVIGTDGTDLFSSFGNSSSIAVTVVTPATGSIFTKNFVGAISADFLTGAGTDQISIDFGVAVHTYKVDAGVSSTSDLDQLTVITGAAGNTNTTLTENVASGAFGSVESFGVEHFTLSIEGGGDHNVFASTNFTGGTRTVNITSSNGANNSLFVSGDNTPVNTLIDSGLISVQSQGTTELEFNQVLTDGFGGVNGLNFSQGIAQSPDGRHVYVTSIIDQSVALFDRDTNTGNLTFVTTFDNNTGGITDMTSPLTIAVSPDGKHVYVGSQGTNALVVFERNEVVGSLSFVATHIDGTEGISGMDGLQHVSISPDGRHLYVSGSTSNSVAAFQRDAVSGKLSFVQAATDGVNGADGLQDVVRTIVSDDGRNLYTAANGENAVGVFARDPATGKLAFVQVLTDGGTGGDFLANVNALALDPTGSHLIAGAFVDSAITVFTRDSGTGQLTFAQALSEGVGGVNGITGVNDVVISPDGTRVYVVGHQADSVVTFSRDTGSGALAQVDRAADGINGFQGLDGVRSAIVSPDGKQVYAVSFTDTSLVGMQTRVGLDLTQNTFASLQVSTGNGDDFTMVFTNGLGGNLTLAAGGGNDQVQINDTNGDDNVVVANTIGFGARVIQTVDVEKLNLDMSGDGDDLVTINLPQTVASQEIQVNGSSAGTDSLDINGPTAARRYDLTAGGIFVGDVGGQELLFLEAEIDSIAMNAAQSVATSPDGHHVYVAGADSNTIAIFERDPATGALTFLSFIQDEVGGVTGLDGVGHVAVSPDGQRVYTASRFESKVSVFDRNASTGELTQVQIVQDGVGGVDGLQGVNQIELSPDGEFLVATGRNENRLGVFSVDSAGLLTFIEAATDASLIGPRGASYSPDGKFIYITGVDGDALTVFEQTAGGSLLFIETIASASAGNSMNDPFDVIVSPDGNNVYVASDQSDSVTVFNRNQSNGTLAFASALFNGVGGVTGIDAASALKISPNGGQLFVAGAFSNAVAVFDRSATGVLTFAEAKVAGASGVNGIAGSRFVALSPDGRQLYAVGEFDDAVAVFELGDQLPILHTGMENLLIQAGNGDDDIFLNGSTEGGNVLVTVLGGQGNDTILVGGEGGPLVLNGEEGDDLIGSGSAGDMLIGGPGNDTILSSAANNTMDGGDNDDTYEFLDGFGDTTVVDSSGNDTFNFNAGIPTTTVLNVQIGISSLTIESNGKTITTTDVIENIIGGTNSDDFAFDDQATLAGGTGTIDGGPGSDVLDYTAYTSPPASADLGAGTATGLSSVVNVESVIGAGATPQLFGPSSYLSFADSPFNSTPFDYFHLEDFTDGLLNTPGVSANLGAVFTTANFFTDSVDGDDGAVDGTGSQEGSFGVVAGAVTLVFTFDEGVLGSLPTHAGLVWTDGLSNPTRFRAFDASNNLLVDSGNLNLPNSGQTQDVTNGEDVFFGVTFAGGIKRIEISETNSIEIDHLQYGFETVFDVFTVTNTNDSGAGSLRDAIVAANAAVNAGRIVFNIPSTDPNFIDSDSAIAGGDAGADVYRITLASPLPDLTNPSGIEIDGLTQIGFGGDTNALGPEIVISGGGTVGDALFLVNGNHDIGGLVFENFGNGTIIAILSNNNVIAGNYIGTDATGTIDRGASFSTGINIQGGNNNTIGGPGGASDRNLISGLGTGVSVNSGTGNQILGNFIGTDRTGSLGLGNASNGVSLLGGTGTIIGAPGAGNVISSNGSVGILLGNTGTVGTVIQANIIGANAAGVSALPNLSDGINIGDCDNTLVGGSNVTFGNIIAFNGDEGVNVGNASASGVTIRNNQIFSNGALGIDLGSNGVTVNDVGDADTGANGLQNFPVITLVESGAVRIVGTLNSTPNTTFDIDFYLNQTADGSGFGEGAIVIDSTQVTTDGSGNAAFDVNFAAGVLPGEFITATATNVTTGNTSEFSQAVAAAAPTTFIVTNTNDSGPGSLRQAITDANAAGSAAAIEFNIPNTDPNFINTDGAIAGGDAGADAYRITLTSLLPNLTNPNGITIDGGTQTSFGGDTNALGPEIIINGGTTLIEALVINSDGNSVSGLVIENFTSNYIRIANRNDNLIFGNYIGTDASGTLDRGGASSTGVQVFGSNNIVGGPAVADRNLISALNRGIQVGGTGTGNQILNNFIGTDRTGQADLGNSLEGILLNGGVNTRIGAPGQGNVIAGNNGIGIILINTGTDGTIIQSNFIGVAADGATPRANGADGINVGASVNTLIGGGTPAEGNLIAHNASNGIDVFNGLASGTTIRNNRIFSNGSLGIDLGSDGVTPNDAGDADTGANALQNFPVISLFEAGAAHFVGSLNSTANTTFDIDFYLNSTADSSGFGEGEIFVGSTQVTTDGSGNAAFDATFAASVGAGQVVTATATNTVTGNTSEFSQAVAATVPGLNYLGPTPYLQASDSPFSGVAFGTFFLENFEDGLLNTPGLTASTGSVFSPGAFQDGVDADDGAIDGTSLTGRSFGVSSGGVTIDFSFNSATLGGFPTHAGVVWTDGQGSPVSFEAFDASGTSLGVSGPFTLTISGVQGNTAEDRFFGVEFAGGISKIRIRDLGGAGLEVDHVQYGLAGAANTFVVTNTNDTGAGSLRDAIAAANAASGTSQILFQIPSTDPNFVDTDSAIAGGDAASDVYVINLATPLPPIAPGGVFINGQTQQAFGGDTNALGPEIVLNGLGAGASAKGIEFISGDNRVEGLVIQQFDVGIRIAGSDNIIANNYIGTDATGTLSRGNAVGVEVTGNSSNNSIGIANNGNVISGNSSGGVSLTGASVVGNKVLGNRIGTDRTGNAELSNDLGVEIINGAHDNIIGSDNSFSEGNTISGNSTVGVLIADLGSTGNIVEGNRIGVNAAGTTALGNSQHGIAIVGANGNRIGIGLSGGPGNVISGNLGHGILLDNADSNIIDGNNIGTLTGGTAGPGNALNGVRLTNGSSLNQIGTNTPQGGNVIAGNGGDGVSIFLSNSNTVNHNRIGLLEGDVVSANGGDGVLILSGLNNVVGGAAVDFANVAADFSNVNNPVSDETGRQWRFGSATTLGGAITTFTTPFVTESVNGWSRAGGSFSSGPFVGRNATGVTQTPATLSVGAGQFVMGPGATGDAVAQLTVPDEDIYQIRGIFKNGNAAGNPTVDVHILVNGVSVFDGFLNLSGFGDEVQSPTLLMDLDVNDTVTFVVGDGNNGFTSDAVIVDAQVNRASGNLISGNAGAGIAINGATSTGNIVQGNLIGTDETGTLDRGNTGIAGIVIDTEANNNVIGGNDADGFGVGNLISGNSGPGVLFANSQTSGNRVQGNLIGTNMFGDAALPNGADGVAISSFASGNLIGGSAPGAGNLISGNGLSGVAIFGSSDGNRVQGNLIGTDFQGLVDLGNGERGIFIGDSTGNTVGTDGDGIGDSSEDNVISGNAFEGVGLFGSATNNVVAGNLIGTNRFGAAAIGNDGRGVLIFGGASNNRVGTDGDGASDVAERNIISGNDLEGVLISDLGSDGNTVAGNFVGTNAAGTLAIGNDLGGVVVQNGAANNLIGGLLVSQRNIISGNGFSGGAGVAIFGDGSTTGNLVHNNFIGTDVTGNLAIGNGREGVFIDAPGNTIGTAGAGNVISGNALEGIRISDDFFGNAAASNSIFANLIGTNAAGTADLGNGADGILIDGSTVTNTVIGASAAGFGNVISGNQFNGIRVTDQAGVTSIVGNRIGTNGAGTAAIANGVSGIFVDGGATLTTIGDGTVGGRNIISGNTVRGVQIDGSGTDISSIRGNFIGTNITGTAALGNGENGVLLSNGATNIFVGGSSAGQGNVISGNALVGVQIANASAISIEGNIIGLNAAGTAALGNGQSGVLINQGAFDNAVGNGAASGRNIISGNTIVGVQIADAGTTNNVVDGNFIGTNLAGTADLGNGQVGVLINFAATGNRIGELDGNVISGNNLIGIQISDGGTSGNTVKANIIGLNAAGDADITDAQIGIDIGNGASNNTIGGPNAGDRNIISGHAFHGVRVIGAASGGNVIEGNFIGTDINGTADRGNLFDGVQIQDGPSNVVRGNLISGNNGDGVDLGPGTGSVVQGNLIGTDITGALDLGNGEAGVRLVGSISASVGGPNAVDRNIISGNNIAGVMIQSNATNNSVQGNFIGTNQAGTAALGNTFDGVQIFGGANGNTIGGLGAGEGNVISGNLQDGIEINGAGVDNNNIFGNLIGLNALGTGALGNGQDGVRLANSDNNDLVANAISANGRDGVLIDGGSTGNILSANKIGTDFAGALDRGNVRNGVRIDASATNTIGGATAGSPGTGLGNVISGNGNAGILIKGAAATGNSILGNVIGANETGTVAIANAADGIYIAGAPGNVIGGPGNGNLISGNIGNGINIGGAASTNNNVQGNFIGTNLAGNAALGNTANGIFVGDNGGRATDPAVGYASGNFIGGASVSARNIISGNGTFGYTSNSVGLAGTGNSVHGNFIGTNAAGTSAVPNQIGGILLHAQNNRIGGANPGEGNVISGNDGPGITLAATFSTGNQIFGNFIGTASSGADALPNVGPGVVANNFGGLGAAINNTVGGVLPGQGNVIAFNQGVGVGVDDNATRISVRGNSIFGNMGIGIDLEVDGVTNNDLDDPDAGSNNRQNFPVLSAAVQGSTIVTGSLNARPNTIHQLDFYSNNAGESGLRQGRVFIGSLQVATNAGGDADFIATLPATTAAGDFITVTATDANGNTSEFSTDVAVSQDTTAPTATLTSAPAVTVAGGTTYTFTVTYADEAALLNSTIGANDVEVHGPNSFTAIATFVSKSTTANAATVVATYRITAPGGTFNSADNGTYDIIAFPDAVTDLAGNGTAGGTLGQFTVAIGIPTGNASTPNVSAGGETTYRFTVTYADPDGIDPATFDNSDVIVNGPLGFTTGVTFIGADRLTRGTPRTATYEFTAPGGFLDAADNGGYQVVIQPNQVSDGRGAFVPSSTAGNFTINIDSSKPIVSQINIASIRSQIAALTFSVTYSDDVSINLSTLDDLDIRVAGPGGFNRRATLIGVSGSGASVVASYAISPLAGPWTSLNNGSYQVFLEANQVADDSGNVAVSKLLSTFRVKISSQTPT